MKGSNSATPTLNLNIPNWLAQIAKEDKNEGERDMKVDKW